MSLVKLLDFNFDVEWRASMPGVFECALRRNRSSAADLRRSPDMQRKRHCLVARFLLGIVFVDAWEQASKRTRYRLSLNPNATNKPKREFLAAFANPYGADITVNEVTCP
jgi:hypothetical protein